MLPRASRKTAAKGIVFRRNDYSFKICRADIVFFCHCTRVEEASTETLDMESLREWAQFQKSARTACPRVGIYFPFEGHSCLWSTLTHFDIGHDSLVLTIPRYLHRFRMGGHMVSDVCIPAIMFAIIKQQVRLNQNETRLSIMRAVPYASQVSNDNAPLPANRVQYTHADPVFVENTSGRIAPLQFDMKGSPECFQRVPAPESVSAFQENFHDMLNDINALGFRVWCCVPLALLQNPSSDGSVIDWRDQQLSIAREVAWLQTTSVLAIGTKKESSVRTIPPDVLIVSPPEGGEDNMAWTWE